MKTIQIFIGCLLCFSAVVAEPDVSVAPTDPVPQITQDLKDAQHRLQLAREKIAAEKPALGKAFEQTQAELIQQRRKARMARMAKEDRAVLLKNLEQKHYVLQQDFTYTNRQLSDYGVMMETFLLPGEEQQYRSALDGIRGSEGTPVDQLARRLVVLEAGLGRLENLLGGCTITGEAVAPDGEVKSGTFAMAGPAIWFVSDDQRLAGSVLREKGNLSPRVTPRDREAIQTVIAGGEAELSMDVTGGKASALAALESNSWDIFRKGGFWIWPILGIALISALSGVMKLIQIVRIRTPQADWVTRILASLREGDTSAAEVTADQAVHPVSGVLKQCLSYVKAGPDVVEEVLYEQLIGVQNKLQSGLSFIAITAATAPLLGLLGTVAGMIRTFNIITVSGTGDAKPLAGGISEALITTLFGLVVAIPALIIHSLLSRRCQGIIQNTEKLGLTFVNGLRGEKSK